MLNFNDLTVVGKQTLTPKERKSKVGLKDDWSEKDFEIEEQTNRRWLRKALKELTKVNYVAKLDFENLTAMVLGDNGSIVMNYTTKSRSRFEEIEIYIKENYRRCKIIRIPNQMMTFGIGNSQKVA